MVSNEIVSIFNLALDAVGARNNVASRTEISRETQVCDLWYEIVRDTIFSAAAWPELTKIAYLTLLDTRDGDEDWVATNARPGYAYAYQLPRDLARPQYLTNFDRFLITSYADDVRVLDSNTEDAVLVYTSNEPGIGAWSPQLKMSVVYGLASHICMPLTGKPSRAKQLVEQANIIISQARETSANASQEVFDYLPDWITARGFSDISQSNRYVYPVGSLLMAVPSAN